eukprot:3467240-Prymnesium_polylepis.1
MWASRVGVTCGRRVVRTTRQPRASRAGAWARTACGICGAAPNSVMRILAVGMKYAWQSTRVGSRGVPWTWTWTWTWT